MPATRYLLLGLLRSVLRQFRRWFVFTSCSLLRLARLDTHAFLHTNIQICDVFDPPPARRGTHLRLVFTGLSGVARSKRLQHAPRSHLTLFLKTHAPFASAERSSLTPFLVLRNLAPYQAKTRLDKGSASIGSIGGSDPFCVRFESIESFFYPLGIKRIFLFIRSPGSSVSLTSFSSPPLRHSETSTAPVHFWVHPPTV